MTQDQDHGGSDGGGPRRLPQLGGAGRRDRRRDPVVSHRATIEYWDRLVDDLGQREVDAFARFYLVPGANHANRGAAFAAGWDSLTALDRWVTTGVAPAHPVVRDDNPGATRTRPLCEYPAYPRYGGAGNPDLASTFDCSTR